jgi:NADH dehydrogenase
MKLLLTGATGFVGQAVMRVAQATFDDVTVYDGRLNDGNTLRAQLESVHTVIHLAGAERRGRPRLLQQVDVFGTEQLLKAAFYRDVQHLIVISRLNAHPEAMYPLLRAKGRVERLVRQSGIPYTIVRSGTLFGRNDRFTNNLAALAAWTAPFVWLPGGGPTTLQPLWVEDAARCIVASVGRTDLYNQTLTIAGSERMRYQAFMREVIDAASLRRWPLRVHPQIIRVTNLGMFGWWRNPPITRFMLDQFSVSEVAELDTVRRQFGFEPARLEHHLSHLRGQNLRWRLFVP